MRCCVELKEVKREINLLDTKNFTSRTIKIWECPKCHFLKAQLQQYNLQKKTFEYESPKRKHLAEWVSKYEQEPYIESYQSENKQGSYEYMNWFYGIGNLIKDFNNTTRGKRNYNIEYELV